jgi:hypothetical protein
MSAATTEQGPEISYHRDFPDSDIRDLARRLTAIVGAYDASVGGTDGPAYMLLDALTATESLAGRLRAKAEMWGLLTSDAAQSHRRPSPL